MKKIPSGFYIKEIPLDEPIEIECGAGLDRRNDSETACRIGMLPMKSP